MGGAQILKNAFVMKKAFHNYAGSIRHTKLPAQYKIGFCRNCHLRLRASKSLRAATGVIVLSVLSGVQEKPDSDGSPKERNFNFTQLNLRCITEVKESSSELTPINWRCGYSRFLYGKYA